MEKGRQVASGNDQIHSSLCSSQPRPTAESWIVKLSDPGSAWSGYIGSLRTFGALGDLKLDWIALLQALVSFRSNGAVVDKDVSAPVPSYKSVAFCVVKPLDRTFQTFHLRPLRHDSVRCLLVPPVVAILRRRFRNCQGWASHTEELSAVAAGIFVKPKHARDGFSVEDLACHHEVYDFTERKKFCFDHFIFFRMRRSGFQTSGQINSHGLSHKSRTRPIAQNALPLSC